MTKTIYSLTPEKRSDYSESILKMIHSHNSGKAEISLDIIVCWIKGEHAQWPTIKCKPEFKINMADGVIEVYEENKFTLTIHEKIIEVLEPTEEDKNLEQK